MPSLDVDRYWRSLDELADTPEFRTFVEKEFPTVANEVVDSSSRRNFMKIMGASLAFAGLTACRWPKEKIVPYAHQPEGTVAGEPVSFATAMEVAGTAIGLLVTSYDGRPTKIEGNPGHPAVLGAASAIAQAAVLEVYDPERSRTPVERSGGKDYARTWDEFLAAARTLFAATRGNGGAGLRILSEASSSPTLAALRAQLAQRLPGAAWIEYEPLSRDAERLGAALAYGRPVRQHYDLAKADVVFALDSDLLQDHPDALRHARGYASRRNAADGTLSRLWAVEAALSVTGAAADERHPVSARHLPLVMYRLAAEIFMRHRVMPEWFTVPMREAVERSLNHPFQPGFIEPLAKDLIAAKGRGIVLAGPSQPKEVHALAALLNLALGNVGGPVQLTDEPNAVPAGHFDALRSLADEMRAGKVETLLVLGGNPVYNAPADLAFGAALAQVKNSIHLGLYRDETAKACTWHAPRAHALEAWGDGRSWDGTLTFQQPLIEPLFGGRTPIELVALLLGDLPASGYELVRQHFVATQSAAKGAFNLALNDGFVAGSALAAFVPTVPSEAAARALAAVPIDDTKPTEGDLDVVFAGDPLLLDGRYANNAWLQETPDPITKLTWDNAALISPATAAKLGIANQDMVKVSVGGRSLEIAALVLPGVAPFTLVLPLGYGRKGIGSVADGAGFDTYQLRTAAGAWLATSARVERTGRRYELVSTQDHWAIDELGKKETERRAGVLIQEGTLGRYKADPKFAQKGHVKLVALWEKHSYDGHLWGMTIDLSSCIGCSACSVACQSENNIPVVGKAQVKRGREMSWIRIDRYFKGNPEQPGVVFQPVACVHCENAPCEQVCPVGATVHSAEGINQMVYNRCIGTRYCANNCPYKVRRFNFFNYQTGVTELQKLQRNPEVTVRSRGVMEKCTYCVQRIERVKIKAKNDRRPIKDGEIVPACAQTCPTQAIVFGDLNDKDSRVRALTDADRTYTLLQELNVKPRTNYLARLRNPVGGDAPPAGGHDTPAGHGAAHGAGEHS